MGLSATAREKAVEGFCTPTTDSPRWADGEVLGEYLVLKDRDSVVIFPKKFVGGKLKSMRVEIVNYRIHLLHVGWMKAQTIRVFKHQSTWLYKDSSDYDREIAWKSNPATDRDAMVKILMQLFHLPKLGADILLGDWTEGH